MTSTNSLPGSRISLNPTGSPTVPRPFISFKAVGDMTVCESGEFTWTDSGNIGQVSLFVTNNLSTELTPLPPGVDPIQVFLVRLPDSGPNGSNTFWWEPVDVPAGTYVIKATSPYLFVPAFSLPFGVNNGTDFSCLANSFPTAIPTMVASSSSSSNSKRMAGAIAGAVVGGVALLAIIIAFIFFLMRARKQRTKRANGDLGSLGRWNGLASRESNIGALPTAADFKKHRKMETIDSMGGVTITTQKEIMGSDDDLSTLAEEKSIKDGSGVKDVESPTHARRASMSSVPTSPTSPSRRSFSQAPPPSEAIAMNNISGK